MIIESLLDTDLYKFTMMQVVLHHFPGAEVEYHFKCRTQGVDLTPYIGQLERERMVPAGSSGPLRMAWLYSPAKKMRPVSACSESMACW